MDKFQSDMTTLYTAMRIHIVLELSHVIFTSSLQVIVSSFSIMEEQSGIRKPTDSEDQ